MKAGDFRNCINSLKKYISAMKPETGDLYNLAVAQFNLKLYDDSFESSTQACRLNPEHQGALTIQALSLKKLGRISEAEALWKLVLTLYPENITALKELDNIRAQEKPESDFTT